MSAIGHAIHKVFHAVTNVWHKIWKPLVIAAAVYFTGGAALGAMGALGAGGSVLGGAAAGLGAAADIGAGGIMGSLAAGAGVAGDVAGIAGAAGAAGAAGDAAGVLGSFSGPGAAGTAAADAAAGWGGAGAGAGSVFGGVDTGAAMGGGMGASSLWTNSLGVAKSVLGTPGVPSLISGLAQGFGNASLLNAEHKWQEQHAPGQVAGGTAGAWGTPGQTFAPNKNLSPQTPNPTAQKLPMLQPYNQPAYQVGQQPMPGVNEPGPYTAIGGQWAGYGTPGYGQQYAGGQQPPGSPYPPTTLAQQQMQTGLLGGGAETMPFIESPYDESYG